MDLEGGGGVGELVEEAREERGEVVVSEHPVRGDAGGVPLGEEGRERVIDEAGLLGVHVVALWQDVTAVDEDGGGVVVAEGRDGVVGAGVAVDVGGVEDGGHASPRSRERARWQRRRTPSPGRRWVLKVVCTASAVVPALASRSLAR